MLRIAWSIDPAQFVDGKPVPRAPKISTPSAIVKLKENQLAKILHFFAFEDTETMDDETALEVIFSDGMKVLYTHDNLFGTPSSFVGGDGGMALSAMPVIVGPAELKLVIINASFAERRRSGALCTIEVAGTAEIVRPTGSGTNAGIQPPTVSAVIKPDQDGPVEILLESSIDMEKTWQPAAPGVYGEKEKQRFFRLRAESR